jgi:hypothetical protein
VVHLASSQRSRGCDTKDGQFDGIGCSAMEVRPNYPSLDEIFLLAHKGILVISFLINRTPSDLRHFSLISSMDLGARMSLIIYL